MLKQNQKEVAGKVEIHMQHWSPPKVAKEWILNSAINRWGLQKKRMVGAVSDEIRKCLPKTVDDWEEYINRAFDGYVTEKKTIYEQLQDILGVKIDPVPNEWDRLFNKVFYVVSIKKAIKRKFKMQKLLKK